MTKEKSNDEEKSILTEDDWEILLPGKDIVLGRTTITIRPLTLSEFSQLTSKTIYILNKLRAGKKFTAEFHTPEGFKRIVAIIVNEAPEMLTMLTGVPVVDIKRLPIAKNLEMASEAWSLNVQDQAALAKNLQGVAQMLQQLTGSLTAMAPAPKKTEGLAMPSKA